RPAAKRNTEHATPNGAAAGRLGHPHPAHAACERGAQMNDKSPTKSKKHVANAAGVLALVGALTGAPEAEAGRGMEVQIEQERLLQLVAVAGEAAAAQTCPEETQIALGDPTPYLLENVSFRDANGALLPGAMMTRDTSAPDSGLSAELAFVATFKSVACAETP